MPERPPIDRDNPSFFRFPYNVVRTGYQPVFLPVVLIVPRRRTAEGIPISNTDVIRLEYSIADAPDPARVAGPFNTGILIPDTSLFSITVSDVERRQNTIDHVGREFRTPEGEVREGEPKEGDTFEYRLSRNNVIDNIPYFQDADYFDLTEFIIDTVDLPAQMRYNFIWEAEYFRRVTDDSGSFICVSDELAISRFIQEINHPGEVHHQMIKSTPSLYFDNQPGQSIADDNLIKFYRPFADILQDIFDESSLLETINHINKIPAQLIPYLAFLIGWDLPNYPNVEDNVRRSLLKNGVKLQRLKGSRRAIIELFDILGFTVDLLNLWTATDGSRFIAPGERLPEELSDQEITTETVCQVEPLLAEYNDPGFGVLEVPVLFIPTSDITLDAFLVEDGSDEDQELSDIADAITLDPDLYSDSECVTPGGIETSQLFRIQTAGITGLSSAQVSIDNETGEGVNELQVGNEPPISIESVTYDPERKIINLSFDHFMDFTVAEKVAETDKVVTKLRNAKLYIFATYNRTKITVPNSLSNNRSNKFDAIIELKETAEAPPQELLEFVVNFLFDIKAFHSILRKLVFTLRVTEVYNVQDFCLGGDVDQEEGTDAGEAQIPPAILPTDISECDPNSVDRGFKPEDFDYREEIIRGLEEEHAAWKSLDGTHDTDPSLDHLSNITPSEPEGTDCQFTQLGQDRVIDDGRFNFDCEEDDRAKLCDPTISPRPPNCFKGRVKDELDPIRIMLLPEISKCRPCELGLGIGYYWTYPTQEKEIKEQIDSQSKSQLLGKALRRYNTPKPRTLHYNDRRRFGDRQGNKDEYLAFNRPSLDIGKDTLGFPSHKFINIRDFAYDFTHSEYRARPWDDEYSLISCDRNRVEENGLDAHLITQTDGDEQLVYDDADLIYLGNGIEAEISSLGDHEDRTFQVTHSIYLFTSKNHPSLTLDATVEITNEQEIDVNASGGVGPIYNSFNSECGLDFRSGYPAEFDRFNVDTADIDFDRGTTLDSVLEELLGIPTSDGTDINLLFKLGSQIFITEGDSDFETFEPFRLDCNCLRFDCGTGTGTSTTGTNTNIEIDRCNIDLFNPADEFDPECDQVAVVSTAILTEEYGSCSILLDGTIPNLLCQFNSDGTIPSAIPDKGTVFFQDEYGIIYESFWETANGRMDITTITKSPRVWGEEPEGFIKNRRVFRKGIITTTRQIIEINDDGTYVIIGEGSEQIVDFFQTTFGCGEERPEDKFCYHIDCAITDDPQFLVTDGTRWTDPENPDDDDVVWPDLVVDSTGEVIGSDLSGISGDTIFEFMDVWGP